jgi:hypothetical protein
LARDHNLRYHCDLRFLPCRHGPPPPPPYHHHHRHHYFRLQHFTPLLVSWLLQGEKDDVVAKKAAYALSKGVGVIACIGETKDEREGGKTIEVVERQVSQRPCTGSSSSSSSFPFLTSSMSSSLWSSKDDDEEGWRA